MPSMSMTAQYYWNAFWTLNADRQIGAMGGCGPIPYSSRQMFIKGEGIVDPYMVREFNRMINRLDGLYLEYEAEKQKSKSKKKR